MSKITEKSVIRPRLKEYLENIKDKTLFPLFYFLAGVIFSSFRLFGSASPLGIAFFAATCGTGSFAACAGAVIGYYIISEPAFYITAAVLFALKAVFKRQGIEVSRGYICFSVFSFVFVSKIITLIDGDFTALAVWSFFISSLGAAAFTYIFSSALYGSQNRLQKAFSAALIISAAIPAFYRFEAVGINVGLTLSALIIFLAAENGGITASTVYGVVIGAFASLFFKDPLYIALLSVSGAAAGIFSAKNKAVLASVSLGAATAVSIFFGAATAVAVSFTVAGVLFILLPKKLKEKISKGQLAADGFVAVPKSALSAAVSEKLKRTADALLDTADVIEEHDPYKKAMKTAEDAEEKYCKKCKKRFSCYGKLYDETVSIFSAAAFEKLNGVSAKNKKEQLAARCERAEDIFGFISEKTIGITPLGDAYRNAAEMIKDGAENAPTADATMEDYLSSFGEKYPSAVIDEAFGIKKITLSGKTASLPADKRLANEVSELLGREYKVISREEGEDGYTVKLTPREKYKATCSGATEGKNGSGICGDSITRFETDDGRFFAALSDGMGSGAEAMADSRMTLKLLKTVLSRGFDGKSAMRAVNSAFADTEKGVSFATVDVFTLNLHNGKAEFIKSGAAPSFVKRGKTVYEIASSTLPAGLSSGGEYDKTPFSLRNGDVIIMMSDGVYEAHRDVRTEIARLPAASPADLCARLISKKANDDKSVIAIKISAA